MSDLIIHTDVVHPYRNDAQDTLKRNISWCMVQHKGNDIYFRVVRKAIDDQQGLQYAAKYAIEHYSPELAEKEKELFFKAKEFWQNFDDNGELYSAISKVLFQR